MAGSNRAKAPPKTLYIVHDAQGGVADYIFTRSVAKRDVKERNEDPYYGLHAPWAFATYDLRRPSPTRPARKGSKVTRGK